MRWFVGISLALIMCLSLYVGSAVASLRGLVEAARAGDATEVMARTDMARLRRSLVDQIVAAYLKQVGRDRPVRPLERLAANTYGPSVADAMITKLITRENLTAILNKGTINAGRASADVQRLADIDTSKLFETLRRISPTKPVEFQIRLGETDNSGRVSLHFQGDGWKLSGIHLPAAVVQVLAQDLLSGKGRNG
jgi:hypothetical protein